ncbi:MAG: SEC-C domain-containing protein, partial [Deltaproteobacteria bacterium]|nr:SEC-C domain-containing protein [Deltaproteobacteria bacterium]
EMIRETIGIGTFKSQAPAKAEAPPGRNTPCPCGSGAKYKRCCGA